MIKTLISVYPDLSSVIAMNYACRLSKILDMEIQPIFVKEPEQGDDVPAVGWVRQKWENSLVEVEQDAMKRLIAAEKSENAKLSSLEVLFGYRDDKILDYLIERPYDLFVEGCLSRFEKSDLMQRARSNLYRKLPCPVIIARNLIEFKKVLFVTGNTAPADKLLPSLIKLFKDRIPRFDLMYCNIIDAGPLEPVSNSSEHFNKADEILNEYGWQPENRFGLQGTPKDLARQIENYSLVATSLPANPERYCGLLELLSDTPSPILFCRHPQETH